MSDKLDDILERLDQLPAKLKPQESRLARALAFVEKILLPLAVFVLSLVTARASDKLASSQLQLSKEQEERQKEQFTIDVQLKYVELFHDDITSADPRRQRLALTLLDIIKDRDLAASLAQWAQGNTTLASDVRARADSIRETIQLLGPLSGYKVGIYYAKNRNDLATEARRIKDSLVEAGFTGVIQFYPVDSAFLRRVNPPRAYEIRYSARREEVVVAILDSLLKRAYPGRNFVLTPLTYSSPNFLSIFLGP